MHFGKMFIYVVCNILLFGVGNGVKTKDRDNNKNPSPTFDGVPMTPLDHLSASLFQNYTNRVRPYCNDHKVVNVTTDLAIRQLIDLDEPSQVAKLKIWMRLGWKDCRLLWDPAQYDGITEMSVPYSDIWVPDISLYERISEEFFGFDDFRPNILNDGTVQYNFPSTIEVLCPINVKLFPFDTQVCSLMFGSWVYHGFSVNVSSKTMAADLSKVKSNVEWVIEKAPAQRHEVYYGGFPQPYPDVTFNIHLRRRPAYYVSNIIIPAIIITSISILGFLLPVDSGEKVGLELTVMLAMSVFQLLIADKLPPSAESTPLIGVYFTFTLLLSGMASLIQVLVLNLHHRGEEKMTEWLAYNILQPLATVTLTNVPGFKPFKCITKQGFALTMAIIFFMFFDNHHSKEGAMLETDIDLVKEEEIIPEDPVLWTLLAKSVDRLGLMIFIAIFFIGTTVIFTEMLYSVHQDL